MSLSKSDRILVTGGSGFLGSFVIERLKHEGYRDVVTVRRNDYDLTHELDIERLYREHKPAVVLHRPFDWLLPHVSSGWAERPPSELASVIFVAK